MCLRGALPILFDVEREERQSDLTGMSACPLCAISGNHNRNYERVASESDLILSERQRSVFSKRSKSRSARTAFVAAVL